MRRRRAIVVFILSVGALLALGAGLSSMIQRTFILEEKSSVVEHSSDSQSPRSEATAIQVLETLEVKGRAPKTGYTRSQFGDGWSKIQGCTTRQIILYRDLTDVVIDDSCAILSGTLDDPYSGERIYFKKEASSEVQIDHVIALSDAWQKGAQQLTKQQRVQLANDPLELIAVSGRENQAKGDGDAATWLPTSKPYRCQYIARQIAVKQKYTLWVTDAEKTAMKRVLGACPEEPLPQP